MAVENNVTTIFVGNYYEVNTTTSEITKYYFAGSARIAVSKQTVPQNPQVTYLLGDHLGSTSIVTDDAGTLLVETRYKPWGEVRYSTPDATLPTRYSYTGQYSHMSDDATDLGNVGFGLMFYNARWYDPSLGRFAQADSIVPDGVQGWDRYAYVNNSPVNFTDPTGHSVDCGLGDPHCSIGKYKLGGLISLYKDYFGKDALERPYNLPKPIRGKLSQEIDDYLRDNPDYSIREDKLLGGSIGGSNNYGLFASIRVDYWRSRCMKSCNGGDLLTEPKNLYRYYDLHENFQVSKFDPSRVNWANVAIDAAGIPLSGIGAGALPSAVKGAMSGASFMSFIAGSGQALDSFSKGNFTAAATTEGLTVAGTVPGPVGVTANGISLVKDINAGFYSVEYLPPIPR